MNKASDWSRFAIAWLCIGMCARTCRAEDSGIYFHLLGQAEGLSESTVTAVVQDGQGFVWLGTQNGLDRYDGFTVRTFRHIAGDPQSLSDGGITALYRDGSGVLWVGTKNGLDRYDPDRETFTRFANRDRDPIGVYAIAEAEAGALWLNTDRGLIHLDAR